MNATKAIPQWAVGLILAAVGSLCTLSAGLMVYVFTEMAQKVDRTSEDMSRVLQQIKVLEIRADTQEKFCRKP